MTPWTVLCQAPLSMEFSKQRILAAAAAAAVAKSLQSCLTLWSGLLFPSSADLPYPGIEPVSPGLAGGIFTTELPGKHYLAHNVTNDNYWVGQEVCSGFSITSYGKMKLLANSIQWFICLYI